MGADKTLRERLGDLKEVISADDNGTVALSEYILFNLKKMGKVDTSLANSCRNPNLNPPLALALSLSLSLALTLALALPLGPAGARAGWLAVASCS